METTIKTTVFAAKLRTRVATLQKKYKADRAAYKIACVKWRAAMQRWLRTEASASHFGFEKSYGGSRKDFTCLPRFWDGAPAAPREPSDKQIREIRSMLHHLGITGQSTVRVSTEMVTKFLGDEAEDE